MRKLLLLLIPVVALAGWLALRRTAPPDVPFTKVTRETLVSTLTTNGKVEPIEWVAVRAEGSGAVQRVHVERGDTVQSGDLLVTLNASEAQAELNSAISRTTQVQAELETQKQGGRAAEQVEIESGLARARADLATAQREVDSLKRLVDRKAATQAELTAAQGNVERAQLQIQSLERRRGSLVTQPDRAAAQARLQEAQSGVTAALQRIATSQIRSPMTGVVYSLEARAGGFINPGDLVASVGKLDRLRVLVYVDEPELGRVQVGMPVTITWDAVPGRQWMGTVEKVPLQVMPLGTRQVGEVVCTIENNDLGLIPGTNVNAEIRSKVVNSALALPKEAVRREANSIGVLKLEGDRVVWKNLKVGASSVTRIQVLEGLSEGDAVALPIDEPLNNGDRVKPTFVR